jgi:hypothetical protein
MRGRAFLNVARRLALLATEEDWRSAAGRAYYGLFHECLAALDRWGFRPVPRDPVHTFVRQRFSFTRNADLKTIGDAIEELVWLRNQADYRLGIPGRFATAVAAQQAVTRAQDAIDLLDQLDADPTRRTAAVAAVRAIFP